jgi:hypothetical protein
MIFSNQKKLAVTIKTLLLPIIHYNFQKNITFLEIGFGVFMILELSIFQIRHEILGHVGLRTIPM